VRAWFGGKSRVAEIVWARLGDVPHYVEPFFGSGAVLLGRPHAPRIETVNDLDTYVANFWRALRAEPEAVAEAANWPVNEADLTARHRWLREQHDFRRRMLADPEYYDTRIAGWWVWGISQWIGGGWCSGIPATKLPHLGTGGAGVHSLRHRRPHLGVHGPGAGIHRGALRGAAQKLPDIYGLGAKGTHQAIFRADNSLLHYMQALAQRLRHVRVCCGEWSRILTPAVISSSFTGVFLDPPYSLAERHEDIYSHDAQGLSQAVGKWAIEHGEDPGLRIALCGYEGEHEMPASWRIVRWSAQGGMGASLAGDTPYLNRHRERIWFSPHCINDGPLFARDASSDRSADSSPP